MADGIIFRTQDLVRWGLAGGSGTGGNLTPLQFDENMWTLLTRIKALETNPPVAISVNGFTVIGSQFQVNMSNGTTRGPYDLPIATFRAVGNWVNSMPLFKLDLVTVPHSGLYLVLQNHTTAIAPAVFDPNATLGGLPLYQLVFGEDAYIYDLGFFFPGKPGIGVDDGFALAGHVFVHPVSLPVVLAGSKASLKVAPLGNLSFPIKVNGTTVGSIDFAAAATVATFTFAAGINIAVGDALTVMKPVALDVDARELAITIKATRTF